MAKTGGIRSYVDLSNFTQLIPISCCFLSCQPLVPTSCSGFVRVTGQERG